MISHNSSSPNSGSGVSITQNYNFFANQPIKNRYKYYHCGNIYNDFEYISNKIASAGSFALFIDRTLQDRLQIYFLSCAILRCNSFP